MFYVAYVDIWINVSSGGVYVFVASLRMNGEIKLTGCFTEQQARLFTSVAHCQYPQQIVNGWSREP